MLSLIHHFAPTSIFTIQVHKEVAARYEGSLSAPTPSAINLAMASTIAVEGQQSAAEMMNSVGRESATGEDNSSATSSGALTAPLVVSRVSLGTLAFARDLFFDYVASQLQPQLGQRWIQRFPALARSSHTHRLATQRTAQQQEGHPSEVPEPSQRFTSVLDLLDADATSSAARSQSSVALSFSVPREFVVPLDIEPSLLSKQPSSLASTSSTSSSFIYLTVRVLDTRVASHLFLSLMKNQFVALQYGKVMPLSAAISGGSAMGPRTAKKNEADDAGEGDGEEEEDEEADPAKFNIDGYLFSKIQTRIGRVPEDKTRCSPNYWKETESVRSGADGHHHGDEDSNDNAGAAASSSFKQSAKKRPRDGAMSANAPASSRGAPSSENPVVLTPMGKGPFFVAIGDTVPSLTAWIACQVTYIGALSNDEEVPSPFAFAVFKLLSLRLLPNEIATKFCTHENYYVRAVGIAAARYSFPPEELIAVLVPTLDSSAVASDAKPSLTSSPSSTSGFEAVTLPSMSSIANAASARYQKDLTTSPTGDEVKAFAMLVAEMGFDPDAAVCELWFPKYTLLASRKHEVLLSSAPTTISSSNSSATAQPVALGILSVSSSLEQKTHPNNTLLIDALKLRLVRYFEGLARQKELLAAATSSSSSAAATKANAGTGGEGDKQATGSTKKAGGGGGGNPFAGLSLKQLRELAALKVREKQMKNLTLIDEEDDAFEVASSSSGDNDEDEDDQHNVAPGVGTSSDGAAVKDNKAAAGAGAKKKSSAGGGGGAPVSEGEIDPYDEAEIFKRSFKAETQRLLMGSGGGGATIGMLTGAGSSSSEVTVTEALHTHAKKIALTLMGFTEPMRADDDLFLAF